jgi:hypothetical protein
MTVWYAVRNETASFRFAYQIVFKEKPENQTTNIVRGFKERGLGRGFGRELIRWNGHVLRMHKNGVTEEENFQKEGRYQGGNRRFRKCHIEWRNNMDG